MSIAGSLLPDPFSEIRVLTLNTVRGANYWSRRPVTRMDLHTGAYEDISSAHVPSFVDQIVTALPGLVEHQCSAGRRGGFVQRLREGTYAAHIVEHVALELQTMVGHDTGFGRTRGTGAPTEYTVVFEHDHEYVGLRAAALALGMVQSAFAGTLQSASAEYAELSAIAATPAPHPLARSVLCGITGSVGRAETRDALAALGIGDNVNEGGVVVGLSPAYLLHAGLPYTHSDLAIILDASPDDVPARFQDPERAARLVSVVADAVPASGAVICASDAPRVQQIVRGAGHDVVEFAADSDVATRVRNAASCAARFMATATRATD